MKLLKRVPLSRQTADLLEEQIRQECWSGSLPGYRKLCKTLDVSPRTINKALDLLERRKVIMPSIKGKPRQIREPDAGQTSNTIERKSLLIIASTPFQLQDIATRRNIEKIDKRFRKKGWQIDYVTHREYTQGKPGRGMQQLYLKHKYHRWLMVSPSLCFVNWSRDRSIRVIHLGAHLQDHGPPSVGISRVSMLEKGVMDLHQAGHTKICALVYINSDIIKTLTLNALHATFKQKGIPFHESYNLVQLHDTSPEALWKALEELFRYSPPTALLVTEGSHIATIYSYCSEKRLRIPQDVSLIVTQESQDFAWFRPVPAFYKLPVDQYVKRISKWLEDYPTKTSKMHLLEAELERGGSILDR